MASASRDDTVEIVRALAERIDRLAPELLPYGKRHGNYWRVGSLAGEEGLSLAVYLYGSKRGRWYDFAAAQGGDCLDLIAATRCHGSLGEAFSWARDWLRMPAQERPMPAATARGPGPEGYRKTAQRMWLGALPVRAGDPVSTYLAGRGIDLALLPRHPNALRYHPRLYHPQYQRHWPAMVAAIAGPDGKHLATHCTYLETRNLAFEDGPAAGKAPIGRDAKRSFGSYAGGCIRLAWGSSNKPWPQMPQGDRLLLGEGIEDTLTGMLRWPDWRAACGVSLSSMLSLELPSQVAELLLLGQYEPNSPAAKTLEKVELRFAGQGRRVWVWEPPVFAKDINATRWERRVQG